MSGTVSPKITGFVSTSGSAVATGGTPAFRWNLYPASLGATELQLRGSSDGGKTYQNWHRPLVTATSTSKGGLGDALWQFILVARKGTADIAGSASDPVTVRVGPVPVAPSAPTPTPTPTPTPALAPDNATLAARLDALTARVTTLETERVTPAGLRRVGASTAADELLAVRAGEIVVVTRG